MKIAFDMPTAVATEPATSLRDTIINFTRSVLPSLPSSVYDYVPFILAGLMALLFTALLVLLVEDSDDSQPTPHSYTDTKSSQNTRDGLRRRLVTLADHSKRAGVDDEDEWDLDAWDPRADLDGTNGRNLKLSQDWIRLQTDKSSTSKSTRSDPRLTPRRLLASPPASAPPQSQNFAPPMLSMAKLIMYRHDQSTKRSRSSSRPSPPPSPPSQGNGSFRHMQYTLKSAVIRPDKMALMESPSTESLTSQRSISPPPILSSSLEAALHALDSSRTSGDSPIQTDTMASSKSHDDLEKASSSTTRRPTRHARSRSITLSLSLPSLPPALQLLPYQDRSSRRSTSSELEEGRASPDAESSDPSDVMLADASRSQSPIRDQTPSTSGTTSQQRGSELLVQLEEGSAR